jgi:hypothetical protein
MCGSTRQRTRAATAWIGLLALLSIAQPPVVRAEAGRNIPTSHKPKPPNPPPTAKPNYLTPMQEPTFLGTLTRIAGDEGTAYAPCSSPSCRWALQVRQTYSKIQPWNSTGTLLAIDNNSAKSMGFGPSHMLLDGSDYTPLDFPSYPYPDFGDFRWYPGPNQPYTQINVSIAGDVLRWVDVRTGMTRSGHEWKFEPQAVQQIGMGEGNISEDARYIALGRTTEVKRGRFQTHVFAVDMYKNRVGDTSWTLPDCDLAPNNNCKVGWFSISPDAHYLVVKYADQGDDDGENKDCVRVFDFNQATLTFTPRPMRRDPPCGLRRNGAPLDRTAGWVYPLKHADMTRSSGVREALIGINSCPDAWSSLGRILRIDLATGDLVTLSPPDAGSDPPRWLTEASAMHVSCRNIDRPGWCFVSYDHSPGKRFDDEIVALSTDGRGSVERFAHQHSYDHEPDLTATERFRAEPHAVPSRDGHRVVWSSNWCWPPTTQPCLEPADVKTYVIDGIGPGGRSNRPRAGPDMRASTDPDPGPAIGLKLVPNPFARSTTIHFELPRDGMVRLEVFDTQGRRIATLADRYFLSGAHAIFWDHAPAAGPVVAPGVYLCRLTAGSLNDQKQMVLLP